MSVVRLAEILRAKYTFGIMQINPPNNTESEVRLSWKVKHAATTQVTNI